MRRVHSQSVSSLVRNAFNELVRTDCGKLGAIDANHAQLADFASSSQVEEGEANNAHLLVGSRGATANEAGGVLAGTDLDIYSQSLSTEACFAINF